MAKYLQLYLDTDFIIPIGVGDSGHFNKYTDQQASRRRWLYFSNSSSGSSFESSEPNKACFEAGKEGYYGAFWHHVENDDNVPGEKFKYLDLLDLSRIISDLREWASATLGTESPELVLNFSTVIPLKARRRFADYVQQKFNNKVRSYSIELNDLLASKIQADYKSMSPSFGDQILIAQSAGQDILLSVMTWCGDNFMQGEEPVRLTKQGSEFLKRALVKIIVDRYNQQLSMLRQDQIEQEYAYQMQFAEKWLTKRQGDKFFWVENFHFSTNPNKLYPGIEIDGKYLNNIEQEAISSSINAISKFYKENIVNRHLHTILVGDIFKEEVFLRSCVSVTSSDGKYTFFNDNVIQEALGRYNVQNSALIEDLRDIERIYLDKVNERAKIRTYVHNAEQLGLLRDKTTSISNKLRNTITDITNRNEALVKSWEAYMRQSDFSNALWMVDQMSSSDDLVNAKSEALECIKQIERYNSMLIDLADLAEVKPVIVCVRNDEEKLRQLISKADELRDLPDSLRAKIQYFQDCNGQYKELRRQFDREQSLIVRKNLIDRMSALTMEELPVTEIDGVSGKISVTSTTIKGFLGFGSKKNITIKLIIDKPLPCRGVLIISPKTITNPEDRYNVYAVNIDKGSEGVVFEMTAEPQTFGLEKNANKLFIKFWPHEEEVISVNTFSFSGSGYVNI